MSELFETTSDEDDDAHDAGQRGYARGYEEDPQDLVGDGIEGEEGQADQTHGTGARDCPAPPAQGHETDVHQDGERHPRDGGQEPNGARSPPG